MAQVNAKCTNCGEHILIDNNKEANVCPNCKEAFITQKAIALYNNGTTNAVQKSGAKNRHAIKSLGRGLLMTLECIGYLFYVIFFIWLFIDITDNLKKK